MTRIALALLLLAWAVPAQAEITVRATLSPSEAAMGEPLSYAVTVSGADDVETPQIKESPAFEVQGTGKSSVFRMINGRTSSEETYTFTLIPRQEGELVIEDTRVVADGDPYLVNRVTATVLPPSSRSRPQAPRAGSGRPRMPQMPQMPGFPPMPDPFGMFDQQGIAEGDVQIDTAIEPESAWLGQQVVLTFTLRRAVDLFSSPRYTPPETPGMRTVELDDPPGGDTRMEVIDGRRWAITERRVALFPLTSGEHEIGPAGLDFSAGPFAAPQHLQTSPIPLKVKPLPAKGRPEYFDGAVGDFKFSAKLDGKELRVGDSANLVVTITGSGNFQDIRAVDVKEGDAFETYDPEVSDALIHSPEGVQGTRTLTYVLVARREGKQQVGPVRFAAFDPEKGKYRTFTAGPFPVTVTAAAAPPAPAAYPAEAEGADHLAPSSRQAALAWAGAAFLAGLVLLGFFALRRPRKVARAEAEPPAAPEPRVDPSAELARLEREDGDLDDAAFVRDLDRALRSGLGERWAVPAPQVDPGCARRLLASASQEERRRVVDLLEQLAALRFAPAAEGVPRADLLASARRVLTGE